jgi:hypothetical protein
LPVMGLLPRRTQAGAAGPESVGDLTVPAWSGTEAAGPEQPGARPPDSDIRRASAGHTTAPALHIIHSMAGP